jgi:hypothetical protein
MNQCPHGFNANAARAGGCRAKTCVSRDRGRWGNPFTRTYSTEAATRPHRERCDVSEFPFSRLALTIRDENDRNRGHHPPNGREQVPVPADRERSLSDGSQRCWREKVFLGHEIASIRWYRRYRATGPNVRLSPLLGEAATALSTRVVAFSRMEDSV